jgi:outer membrane receptor protein involved in Fe transport
LRHIDLEYADWWDTNSLSVTITSATERSERGWFRRPTRALFERTQSIIKTICDQPRGSRYLGFFLQPRQRGQERPFVLQIFGPQPTFVSDHTEEIAGFLQGDTHANREPDLCAGGRFDHFNQFGGVWTYRVAGSYKIARTNTILHSSVATGFSPPSSQDKIFGNNFGLKPEHDFGWDIGVRQELWENRVALGLTYFHNDLSNAIGSNGLFQTLNLGAGRNAGT